MIREAHVPILVGLILLAGCGITEPETWDNRGMDLERARARWSEADPGSYEYALFRGCFCAGPVGHFVVTVTGGTVTAAVRGPDGEPVPESALPGMPTVEDLFDVVGNAIQSQVDGFRVDYHPEYGYPTLIDIDREEHAIDDELRIEAGDLVPLSPGASSGAALRHETGA